MKGSIKTFLDFSLLDGYLYLKKKIYSRSQKRHRKISIDQYLENSCVKKLNIGCGSNVLPGWLNTDINALQEEVVYLDAGKIFPFDDNTFDFVFSEHLFEHLSPTRQVNFLKESRRVLKNGGVLRIATPNLGFLISLYQAKNLSENRDYLYWAFHQSKALKELPREAQGDTTSYTYIINNFFRAWGHQMIHNHDSLTKLAINCGFSLVGNQKVGLSEFSDLKDIERHGKVIPAHFNEKETMIIEFRK